MEKLLDDQIESQLREIFSKLDKQVGLLFFEKADSDCQYCQQTRQLLEQVSSLSQLISLKVYDQKDVEELSLKYGIDKVPGLIVGQIDGDDFYDFGIRFSGIPAGHEFTSLISSILMVSSNKSGLSSESIEYLDTLKIPVNIQVFVTPTCPYCTQAVIIAHQMAFQSPLVKAEMVEAMEFPALANQFHVSGVPHTVINHGIGEIIGAPQEAVLLDKIKEINTK